MKKAIMFLILAAMLTGCTNSENEAATAVTPEIIQTVTTVTVASVPETETTTTSSDMTETTETSDTTAESTSKTDTETSVTSVTEASVSASISSTRKPEPQSGGRDTATATTTTKAVTSISAESSRNTAASEASASKGTTSLAVTSKSETTTTTAKKISETAATTTTAKPKQSSTTTTTAKPKSSTTTTKEPEYVEIKDVTCLATMVENLEETNTPPSYYEKIGKGLKHDGTDYGKAVAVYKWMRKNGWGSCVYYAMETYFVCKGIGLECAYAFATENGWYGHTYSVVKVNGIWYVLDTQGRSFLENSEYCTRMFDGNDKDMTPFKEDIWYDYDENGEYRDWTIS